ncbi:hypothetical protein J6590_009684 [Homalodisca vitripennis]|nr:hypothetical protein J6590_009684 [Homalodisca vitripennis]
MANLRVNATAAAPLAKQSRAIAQIATGQSQAALSPRPVSPRACSFRHGLNEFMMILLKFKTQVSFSDLTTVVKRESSEFVHRSEEPEIGYAWHPHRQKAGPLPYTKPGSVRASRVCLMPDYVRCSPLYSDHTSDQGRIEIGPLRCVNVCIYAGSMMIGRRREWFSRKLFLKYIYRMISF